MWVRISGLLYYGGYDYGLFDMKLAKHNTTNAPYTDHSTHTLRLSRNAQSSIIFGLSAFL